MNISIVYVNYKTARLILDSIKSVKEKRKMLIMRLSL